ncbi:MAG: hypothetical protein JXB39_01355 [Deltaproteobacteria bacterium]|nr:hypothetical protein [Deltaproteobacteria bacterium]
MRFLPGLLLALLFACGTEEIEPVEPPPEPALPACPPGEVLLDGQPVVLGHGLAVHGLLYDGWAVSLFDTEGVECSDVLARTSPKRAQRQELRIQTGLYGGVWFGESQEANAELTLEEKAVRLGGRVAICVREPVRIRIAPGPGGAASTLVVEGLFEGAYCGQTKS